MAAARTMADAVRAILVKRAFVPGDPSMAGGSGGMPPGGDPAAAGGMPPPGGDPSMGGLPPGGDPAAMGGDPSMGGMPPPGGDPMGGIPGGGAMPPDMPQTGMINMTADEFTKFVKQMMAAFSQNSCSPTQQQQSAQPDIGAKLDTLIAVLQGQAKPQVPAVVGA